MILPGLESAFGFGYALLAGGTVVNGVTVTLFSGATNLGSLSFTALPDPTFPGGYADIASDVAFTSAQITFSSVASAYDFDNVAAISAVPEPATLALTGAGLLALVLARRRRAICRQ